MISTKFIYKGKLQIRVDITYQSNKDIIYIII